MPIFFNSSLIELNVDCSTATEAIERSGELLCSKGLCTPNYINEMKNVYQKFGAYIVLDTGIAMPHARPEHGALKTGFCIITLKTPLVFGHENFDPVDLVIAITTTSSSEHIKLIQLIATLIESDLRSMTKLSKNKIDVFKFINKLINENI